MPTLKQINDLAQEMHAKKVINLDMSARDLLSVNATGLHNPGMEVGIYVLGGDHYVVVCGLEKGKMNTNPANIGG